MSGFKVLVLICLVAVAAGENELSQAGQQFSAAFQSLGQYFVQKYKNVQDFFANTKTDLDRKVSDTANFLNDAKSNMKALMDDAIRRGDAQLQSALSNVDRFSQDVNNFQAKLSNVKSSAEAQVQQLEQEWNDQAKTMYNGGLDKIMQAAQAAKAGSGSARMNIFLLSTALVLCAAKILMQ